MATSQIKSDIKKYGLHIIHVMGEDDLPNFSYTIGLFETYQQPEIIIFGLEQDMHQVLLNNMAYDYKEGKKPVHGILYVDILDEYECYLINVEKEHFEEYLGIAIDYYQATDFPVMQIVWPANNRKFPFDEGAPDSFKKWQPVLGKL